jgi:hypothetical protein
MVDSQHVISFEEIAWGITLVAITMGIHAIGMVITLAYNAFLERKSSKKHTFLYGLVKITSISWVIVLVHLIEVLFWAIFLILQNAFTNPSDAIYYSLMQYTTVGSNFELSHRWRLLGGMLSIAGLMTFAWSTGVMFSMASEFQDNQLMLLKSLREKHQLRNTLDVQDSGQ